MKKILSILGIFTIFINTTTNIISCSSNFQNKHILSSFKEILWNYSAEKKASLLTQYNNAITQFDNIIKNQNNQPFLDLNTIKAIPNPNGTYNIQINKPQLNKYIPVVITDIDETLIDNTLFTIYNTLNNFSFNPKLWHKWINATKSPIFEGVIKFVKHVWESGGVIIFNSNRNQGDYAGNFTGDQTAKTRENLINYGYPIEFLDSYVWWMRGVLTNEDKDIGQNDTTIQKLFSKENRFNYINENPISFRTMKQLGIKNGWKDINSNNFKNINVKIIMKIGDDLNDFNDNLTEFNPNFKNKDDKLFIRNLYLENENIKLLFGNINPAIWFKQENKKLIQYSNTTNINNKLQKNNFVNEIKTTTEKNNFILHQTYSLIGGNVQYGSWINSLNHKYGNDFNSLKKLVEYYFENNNGYKIFNL